MKHNWEYKKLGDICSIVGRIGFRGYTREDLVEKGNGAISLSPSNIIDGKLNFDDKVSYLSWEKYYESPEIMLAEGDVVFTKTASIGKCALVKKLPVETTLNPQLVVLKNIQCDSSYLTYTLQDKRFQEAVLSKKGGTSIPTISQAFLGSLPVPVPPIETQKQIVAELDKINETIEDCRELLRNLDALSQSLFYDFFGDPFNNPKGFSIVPLSDVFSLITDGTHQTPTYTSDIENGVKFLSAKDVVNGYIEWDKIKYIPYDLHVELHRRLAPQRGDILLCKNGTTGICALVETDEIFDIYVSLALLRPKTNTCAKYIVYAINNPFTKEQFNHSLKGIGVPNLHLNKIRSTKIILPPLELQKKFAERIELIDAQKKVVESTIAELQTLLDSRMDYWFN